MVTINLGRKVKGEKLEKALLEAAKEAGFKTEVHDRTQTEYELNPARKNPVYIESNITITDNKGRSYEIRFNRKELQSLISAPGEYEIPLEYLDALSKRLG